MSIFRKFLPFLFFSYFFWINLPSPFNIAAKFLVYLSVFAVIFLDGKRFFYVTLRDPTLILLTGLACISYAWSSTPEVTEQAARNLIVLHLSASYLALEFSLKENIKFLAITLSLLTIASLIVCILIPSYGIWQHDQTWIGVFRHKNRLANAMVTSILTWLSLLFFRRKSNLNSIGYASIAIGLFLLLMSRGKGALASLILMLPSLVMYWALKRKKYKDRIVWGISFCILLSSIIALLTINIEYIVIDVLQKDFTLTGRIDLWKYLIDRGLSHPILGFGYEGFWKNAQEAAGVYKVEPWFLSALNGSGNAHSGYIDIFLQFGLVGILLLFISHIWVGYRLIFLLLKTRKIEFFWAIQYIVLVIIFNISETNEVWLGSLSIGWFIYTIIAISSQLEMQAIKASQVYTFFNPYIRHPGEIYER